MAPFVCTLITEIWKIQTLSEAGKRHPQQTKLNLHVYGGSAEAASKWVQPERLAKNKSLFSAPKNGKEMLLRLGWRLARPT